MNPVCYLNELGHSLLSGNANCCFREFGESAFGVHCRDPEAFCHSGNGSLIVKHAECRKEDLFSSRQVLWISLGCAYKQINKYFSLPRASEEARSLDNSNGPAPSLKDQFSSPSNGQHIIVAPLLQPGTSPSVTGPLLFEHQKYPSSAVCRLSIGKNAKKCRPSGSSFVSAFPCSSTSTVEAINDEPNPFCEV